MKYFISTLNRSGIVDYQNAKPVYAVHLLTLSIVKESGESITLLSKDFNPSQIEGRYLQTIANSSGYSAENITEDSLVKTVNLLQDSIGLSRHKMKKAVQEFMPSGGYVYGYYPYTDFVCFQSIGVDLLNGNYFHDLKQYQDLLETGNAFATEDHRYPVKVWEEQGILPSSLTVANWHKDLYNFLQIFKEEHKN